MLAPSLSSLALIATSLLPAANALLIPSTVSPANIEPARGSSTLLIGISKVTKSLNCTSCPLAVGNSPYGEPERWVQGPDTRLEMEFSVQGKRIYLNGELLYPQPPGVAKAALVAHQFYADPDALPADAPALHRNPLALSTSVYLHPLTRAGLFPGMASFSKGPSMRRISVEVLGLGVQVVKVDTVEIRFSESDRTITLHGIYTTPYSQRVSPQADRCTTVMCRAKANLEREGAALLRYKNKCMHKMMLALGAHTTAAEPASKITDPSTGTVSYGGKPLRFGTAARHHHSKCRGVRHVLHVVARFLKHIILPVFIGLSAGMAVSGIGMVIGQLIVFLWTRFYRGGHRQSSSSYQAVDQIDIIIVEEEAVDSKDVEEGLPKYEDVYTEPTEDVMDEKKELLG